MGAAIAIVHIAHRRSTIALPRRPFFGPVVPRPSRERLPRGTSDADASGKMRVLAGPGSYIAIHTVQKRFALRYANLMIRLLGALAAFLAICPIAVYYAGSSTASPPGGPGQCSFVLEGPKVVNVSGVNYVTAVVHAGSCTLHAHTESTVCLSVDGDDSAGQCESGYDPQPAVVYYPYRPGATYVVKGKGCSDTLEGSQSPATPATVCQDISPSRVRL